MSHPTEKLDESTELQQIEERILSSGEQQKALEIAFQLADGHELDAARFFMSAADKAAQTPEGRERAIQLLIQGLGFVRRSPYENVKSTGCMEIAEQMLALGAGDAVRNVSLEADRWTHDMIGAGTRTPQLVKLAGFHERLGNNILATRALQEALKLTDEDPSIFTVQDVAKELVKIGKSELVLPLALRINDEMTVVQLATSMIEHGDVDVATELIRRSPWEYRDLEAAQLLASHGKGEDALALVTSEDGATLEIQDYRIVELASTFAEQGQANFVTAILAKSEQIDSYYRGLIVKAYVRGGHGDKAIELANRIEKPQSYLPKVFAEAGFLDEAVDLLARYPSYYQADAIASIAGLLGQRPADQQATDEDWIALHHATRGISGDNVSTWRALAGVGKGAYRAGQTELVETINEELRENSETLEQPYDQSLLLLLRADFAVSTDAGENARFLIDQALRQIDQLGDVGVQMKIQADAARIFAQIGDQDRAHQLAQRIGNDAHWESMSRSEQFEIAVNLVRAGEPSDAAQIISCGEDNASAAGDIASLMIENGAIDEAFRLAQLMKGEGRTVEFLTRRLAHEFIAIGRPDLALPTASRLSFDHNRFELAKELFENGHQDAALAVAQKISLEGQWFAPDLVEAALKSGCSQSVIDQLVGLIKDEERFGSVAIRLCEQGYVDSARRLVAHVPHDEWSIGRVAHATAEQGRTREALGLAARINDADQRRAISQSLAGFKMMEQLRAFVKTSEILVHSADYGIDINRLVELYQTSGKTPSSEILENLVFLDASDEQIDRLVSLFPEDQRREISRRYRRYSGHMLSGVYEDVLPDEVRGFSETAAIDFHRLGREWIWGNPSRVTETQMKNLEVVKELEQEQQGIVERLYKESHIANLARYPKEILTEMLDPENSKKPYLFVLLTKYDHNGAFYNLPDRLRELREKLAGRYVIRVAEAGNRIGVTRRLVDAFKQYGKIGPRIWGAHGQAKGMRFGPEDQDFIGVTDLESAAARTLNVDMYIENSPELFLSCSTGSVGGFAHHSSKISGAERTAPKEPGSISAIEPIFREDGTLERFNASFFGTQVARFVRGFAEPS